MKNTLPKDITVVIVNDFDYIQGGASKVALETANALYEKGYRVIFFSGTHDNKKCPNCKYENITASIPECLKDKNKIRGALRGLYNFKSKKEFKKLLSKLDPNKTVIHVHGWTKSLSSSIFSIAFKKNFKVILTLHDYFTSCPNGGFFNYNTNQICKVNPLSYKCICVNCDSRNYAFKLYRIIRQFIQNKIVKLPSKLQNIIYISDLQWKVLKENFNQNVNAKKILNPIDNYNPKNISNISKEDYYLYVGRVSKEKGVDLFCAAITDLNLEGIVVGDGEELKRLQLSYPKVKFVGWQEKKETEKYMSKAKALIFPSLWYEGAPLTVEEALNLELPCIVSDSSSAVEKIIDGKNGYIFKSNNIDDLKNKILLIDKLKYKKVHISNSKEIEIKEIQKDYEKLF